MIDLSDDSIFKDSYLITKFESALEKIENLKDAERVMKDITDICSLCRDQGWKALETKIIKQSNRFVRGFLELICQSNSPEELKCAIDISKPRLYHFHYDGNEYVEAVVYFEALLLVLSGEHTEIVKLKIQSMLDL